MGEGGHPPGFFAMPRLQGSIPGVAQDPGDHSADDVFVLRNQDDAGLGGGEVRLSQSSLRWVGWGQILKLHAGALESMSRQ
jgi:hypothetical protein